MDILYNIESIVIGLIGSLIWAAITLIHFRQTRGKRRTLYLNFTNNIHFYFKNIEVFSDEKFQIVDRQIDEQPCLVAGNRLYWNR